MSTSSSPIAAYLVELERVLRWFGIIDRRVVEEAEGHLVDAAARERSHGLDADSAERVAVTQFGRPAALAARFAISRYARPGGILLVSSTLVSFAILAIGFRILYDSVLPEVAGLVLAGVLFAYVRPGFAWLSVIGIGLGIVLSERGFPVTPSAEHIARYGPPVKGSFVDFLKLCGFPTAGALVGLVSRFVLDPPLRRRHAR
jgi:hypothetical protein